MGKKPVVGLIGLVWAGIALSGSGCCSSCGRNKYNATPAFGSSSASTPTMIGDGRPAGGAAIQPAGRPDVGGTAGFSNDVRPAGAGAMHGMPTGVPPAPAMPGGTQDTLRPSHDRFGTGGGAMPGRNDDLGSRMPSTPPASRFNTTSDRRSVTPPLPVTRSTPGNEGPLPPAPVPADGTPMATSGQQLPPIESSSTPPLPGGSTTPPPPGMPR